MAIEILCPKGHKLQVSEAYYGKQVRCPTCNEIFVVPDVGAQEPPPQAPPLIVPPQPPPRIASRRSRRGSRLTFEGFSQGAGRPVLLLGLVLVIFARGCDKLGTRAVNAARTRHSLAKRKFEHEWDLKRVSDEKDMLEYKHKAQDLQDKKTKLRREGMMGRRGEPAGKLGTLDEQIKGIDADLKRNAEQAEDVVDKINDSKREQTKKQDALELEEWRSLDYEADVSNAKNQIWGYWRHLLFMAGTVAVAIALIAVTSVAQGAERWACLTMLAVIVFSIYIGGTAWMG